MCVSTYIYVYITHCTFFMHSAIDGHLGCSLDLAVVNTAAVNIGVRASFWIRVLPGYLPRSGVLLPLVRHLPSLQPLFPYPVTPCCSPAGAQILRP